MKTVIIVKIFKNNFLPAQNKHTMYRINYSTIPDDIIWDSFKLYKRYDNYIARFATESNPDADLFFYEDGDLAKLNEFPNCTTSYSSEEQLTRTVKRFIDQLKEEVPIFVKTVNL